MGGKFGSVFFWGCYDERQVAVAKMKKSAISPYTCDTHRSLNHLNVLKMYHTEEDFEFRYTLHHNNHLIQIFNEICFL